MDLNVIINLYSFEVDTKIVAKCFAESTSSESRGLNVTGVFSGPPKQSNTSFRLRAMNTTGILL